MTRRRRRDELTRTARILTDLEARFPDAWRRHQDARPALPGATSTDRDGGGSGPTDPTMGLALTGAQSAHDAETARVDQAIRDLVRAADYLGRFVAANTARTATARDRREADRANTAEPECALMRRHTDTHEPALCDSDLGGLLDHPVPVSRWVHDFARRTGRLPTRAECRQHANGQRVMIHQQGTTR